MCVWVCVWVVCAGMLAALPAAAGEPPECTVEACRYISGGLNEHQYSINNQTIIITISDGEYLHVQCYGADVLGSGALPRARVQLRVPRVTLSACSLPARGAALAHSLRALNVTLACTARAPCALTLDRLPPAPALAATHLTGLPPLAALVVTAAAGAPARPKPGFLGPLTELTALTLQHVALPAGELQTVPRPLRVLELRHTGVRRAPPTLKSLPALRWLAVESESALEGTDPPPWLRVLDLASNATTFGSRAGAALENLTLSAWTEPRPEPLSECGALRSLRLLVPALQSLPEGWVSRCGRLVTLAVLYARRLKALPTRLLSGAGALRSLALSSQGALVSLPRDLLEYSPDLEELQLFDNGLLVLPSGLLSGTRRLLALDLSNNQLDERALQHLQPLTSLAELRLADNTRLTDLCTTIGLSRISGASRLRTLDLSGTGVTRICRDWREDMKLLEVLNLRDTNVSELWFEELMFERDASVENARVLLEGAPLEAVVLRRVDYARVAGRAPAQRRESVYLDAELACDCRMYWTRRALQHLRHVSELRCTSGRPLENLTPEDMLCAGSDRCSPFRNLTRACTTWWRPDDESGSARPLVRLTCAGADLRRVPAPAPVLGAHHVPCYYELQLANNSISELQADQLYDDIKGLDLRNNSLTTVSAGAAARLRALRGVLRLAHNPLDCSCSHAAAVRSLQGRADLENATCSSGEPLVSASAEPCEPRGARLAVWLAAGLAVLLSLALAALAALASRSRRLFLKVVLHRWGCLWRAAESSEEAARPYDAFVTFSHEDEAAALELVRRLEPAYRLCVHYRDWTPGRLIAEQAAESVERSRRTVALVSRHFLASTWAQVEFREAHAAALRDRSPRLVVVLLEDPSALPLDATLRRYLRTNTYVRWTDPWLWDKLRVALPPPHATTKEETTLITDVVATSVKPSLKITRVVHDVSLHPAATLTPFETKPERLEPANSFSRATRTEVVLSPAALSESSDSRGSVSSDMRGSVSSDISFSSSGVSSEVSSPPRGWGRGVLPPAPLHKFSVAAVS